MACGIPTILSANTGHLDLIRDGNCYVLTHQKSIGGVGHDGWGESDVDEIVASLETVYTNWQEAVSSGLRGSEFISRCTWAAQMGELADVIRPYMSPHQT